MKSHYQKDLNNPEKIIEGVLYVGIVDGNAPASVVFHNGKEFSIRLDRIESIMEDDLGGEYAQIVRCRDCKYLGPPSRIECAYICKNDLSPCRRRAVSCADYCGYGEKEAHP